MATKRNGENKKDFDVDALTDTTGQHSRDIGDLTNRVSNLEDKASKNYTTERGEEFRDVVKKITLEAIDTTDGRNRVKLLAKESAKEVVDENEREKAEKSTAKRWQNLTFWIPTGISLLALIAAGASAYAAFKPNAVTEPTAQQPTSPQYTPTLPLQIP